MSLRAEWLDVPMGLGTWTIGGPVSSEGLSEGWGDVDDAESIRAVRRAVDLGVRLFDTADAYGAGHSERMLGKALASDRWRSLLVSKFGYVPDEAARRLIGEGRTPEYIRPALEKSLRRLGTGYLDLYLLHLGDCPMEDAAAIRDVLEELVAERRIRGYGWSGG